MECYLARSRVGRRKMYRRLEGQYANRRMLYTAAETSRRLKAFINIVSSGGYNRNGRYSFGPMSLAKDAFLGIFLGQRLKRPP